jgi:hypothetical protein
VKLSLGRIAHDQAKAEARRLAVEWEQKFAEAARASWAKLAPPRGSLSLADRERYCAAWIAYWLAEDEAQRRAGISEAEHRNGMAIARDQLIEARERLARADTSQTAATLDDVFDALGLPLPSEHSEREALAFDLLKSDVLLCEAIVRRDRGEIVDTPRQPAAPVSSTAPSEARVAGGGGQEVHLT